MKKIHFDTEKDGFYGAYWKCAAGSDCAMITMLGDDPEDYMARSAVRYLLSLGINVLTMSPAKKDYGHHNYPLERIEQAIKWLKKHGNRRSFHHRNPGPDRGLVFSRADPHHRHDPQRFHLAGLHAGEKRRLQGMAH